MIRILNISQRFHLHMNMMAMFLHIFQILLLMAYLLKLKEIISLEKMAQCFYHIEIKHGQINSILTCVTNMKLSISA